MLSVDSRNSDRDVLEDVEKNADGVERGHNGDVVLGMKPVSKDDIDPFEEIMEKVSYYTGVSKEYLEKNGLKIDDNTYRQAMLTRYQHHWQLLGEQPAAINAASHILKL